MSDDKTKNRKENSKQPVKVIRNGAIAASIWKRQTSTGFEYLDFSLSRSWKLKSGEKEGYSTSFFHNNEDALIDVVEQAGEYIRARNISLCAVESQSPVNDNALNSP
jgi:hypothetical protein